MLRCRPGGLAFLFTLPLLAVLTKYVADIAAPSSTVATTTPKSHQDHLDNLAAATSDRSIYPWGLRVCSGLGEGRLITSTGSSKAPSRKAAGGNEPIEIFHVTNNCNLSAASSASSPLSSPPVEVIYAHIGPSLKGGEHLLDSLAITRRANPCISIRLLLSKAAFIDTPSVRRTCECYGITVVFIESFENDVLLMHLRDVFVIPGNMGDVSKNQQVNLSTASRLFYIRAYLSAFDVYHAIHLEKNNPVYVDLARLGNAYDGCGVELGVPMGNSKAYAMEFTYLKPEPLQRMLEHYIDCFREVGRTNQTKRLNTTWVNDSSLVAEYAAAYPGAVTALPVNPQQEDCAANSTHVYIDVTSISDQDGRGGYEGSLDPLSYRFGWKEQPDHRCYGPVLRTKDWSSPGKDEAQYLRFANLHIDNKDVHGAVPTCFRHQTYPFAAFENLSSIVLEDMAHDISAGPGGDRRGSYPLITGDGFRSLCRNVCDSFGCNFELSSLRRGDCIMLESRNKNKAMPNLLALFKCTDPTQYTPPYVILSHNSDSSYPKTGRLADIEFDYTEFLDSTLVHHWFASNCEWRGFAAGQPRPAKLTCLPIGIENRYNRIGKNPARYFKAMTLPLERRRIMYVSFSRSGLKPQRGEVLEYLEGIGAGSSENNSLTWITYHVTQEPWDDFARRVRDHKFVLCPHGHGLDTHRLWEVLLLGSVPVVKSSTLDSLYEGLPVVILNDWSELTEERLEVEWKRIMSIDEFELDRIFWPYWENTVRRRIDEARSYFKETKPTNSSTDILPFGKITCSVHVDVESNEAKQQGNIINLLKAGNK